MNDKELKEIREYYETHDAASNIEMAEWDAETVDAPMVGITVRLPAGVLQSVRQVAAARNLKTTALIRRWVEIAVSNEVVNTATVRPEAQVKTGFRISATSGGINGSLSTDAAAFMKAKGLISAQQVRNAHTERRRSHRRNRDVAAA